jgi:uncharacterized coiled-coil DUF342 family protein
MKGKESMKLEDADIDDLCTRAQKIVEELTGERDKLQDERDKLQENLVDVRDELTEARAELAEAHAKINELEQMALLQSES